MNSEQRFRYDVFVSYRWIDPDKTWVQKELVPALISSGLKVCIDVKDFVLGKDMILEMERAIKESRRAICILSPEYFIGNNFALFESLMLRRRDPGGLQSGLIPFVIRDCPIPEWLGGVIRINWFEDTDNSLEWRKLLSILGAQRNDSNPPGPITQQNTRDNFISLMKPFDVGEAARKIDEAKAIENHSDLTIELKHELDRRSDPTERYWIYVVLGKIGGTNANAILKQGLHDPDLFAREGAKDALLKVGNSELI